MGPKRTIRTINEMTKIIEENQCTNIIWNGDLNWNPSKNSGFSLTLKHFVEKFGFIPLWEHYDVDYTHMHTDFKSTSVLDHFLVTENLLPQVEECKVVHRGDNLSRHSPVLLKLRVGDIPTKAKTKIWKPKKPAWYKADRDVLEEYKVDLHERLSLRTIPDSLGCSDPNCVDLSHSLARDNYVLDILYSVIESSHCVVPLPLAGGNSPGSHSGCIPG